MFELPSVVVGEVARHHAVAVLPIYAPAAGPAIAYRLGSDALASGALEVHELGAVDRVEARNRAGDRVLFVEGDHLIGAKQNRVLTSSALVGARQRLALPAACVERGRWTGPVQHFAGTATVAPAGLRRIVKASVTRSLLETSRRAADQSRIWSQIAEQQRRLRISSATSALAHSFVARAAEITGIAIELPYRADATGIAIAIAGELYSIDLFDKPETCRHYWPQLVEGAALESLGRRAAPAVGASEVRELIERLRRAAWRPVPPVGEGDELRTASDGVSASALALDGQLVHLGAVTSVALHSVARPVRRELPEQLADRYRIVSRIGVGGAKEVFRATELATGRDVAIARLPAVDDLELAEELDVARRVGSAYTPEIYDTLVDDDGDGYIVMEYCTGPSLAQLADRPLSLADAAPIMLALARVLRAIHAAHVLHRDVKLENALVCATPDGPRLKVIDFGLSRRAMRSATAVGQVPIAGTLPYMAREVLRGHTVDARADVFAFGVCCFRLLAGAIPVPPAEGEPAFDYMQRLAAVASHDLSRLPGLPAAVRSVLARTLEMDRSQRPFMPEVVAELEQALGDLPFAIPARSTPAAHPAVPVRRIAIAVGAPEHVVVAPCRHAPLVVLEPDRDTTMVRAFGEAGDERWSCRVEGRACAGVRADLDGDGERELYLAGPARIIALDAHGRVRYSRAAAAGSSPSLVAIADPRQPRIVVDGRLFRPATGDDLGQLYVYAGNGRELVDAGDASGMSYNGHALQSFRGAHGTAAAIVSHPDEARFCVAHLEDHGRCVRLVVYGPGGARLHALPIAECNLATGDRSAIGRAQRAQLFGPEHAPLALLGEGSTAVVFAPLLAADPMLPSTIVAFALPSGRELWRARLDTTGARALLVDLDGDGKPELVVGTGAELVAFAPWTGEIKARSACTGLPVAFGDPFGTGAARLVTASRDGIELHRGPACRPGAMQWAGARGDLWRTGTQGPGGTPLGPI